METINYTKLFILLLYNRQYETIPDFNARKYMNLKSDLIVDEDKFDVRPINSSSDNIRLAFY